MSRQQCKKCIVETVFRLRDDVFSLIDMNVLTLDSISERVLLMMRYQDIYKRTLLKWGKDAQYEQTVEECAELIATLKHFSRGKVSDDVVVDELADVYLMVGQLTYMFGEEKLAAAVKRKLAKLEKLLEED